MNAYDTLLSLLYQENKINTYKFALVRALSDLSLGYCSMKATEAHVAVPMRKIAELWMSYFWVFCDPAQPILQGPVSSKNGVEQQDISFRRSLTHLRAYTEEHGLLERDGKAGYLIHQRVQLASEHGEFRALYEQALSDLARAVRQPVEYAGPGSSHSLFPRPTRQKNLTGVTFLPDIKPNDLCVQVPVPLWQEVQSMSRSVESTAVLQWAKFMSSLKKPSCTYAEALALLRSHPVSGDPPGWEKESLLVPVQRGLIARCPWSSRPLDASHFQVDHMIPPDVLPIQEWWNLIPVDPQFQQQTRNTKLMVHEDDRRLVTHRLTHVFEAYHATPALSPYLEADAHHRFGLRTWDAAVLAEQVTVMNLQVADRCGRSRFRVVQ